MNNADYFYLKHMATEMGAALAALNEKIESLEAELSEVRNSVSSTNLKTFMEKTHLAVEVKELKKSIETMNKKVPTKPVKVTTKAAPFVRKKPNGTT